MNLNNIENLLDEVSVISLSYRNLLKSSGESFNIFSILGKEYDENQTHSRFISELLNSSGSHSQGNVFLKLFCGIFEIQNFDVDNYVVICEYIIGNISEDYLIGGRIDILLRDKNKNTILIENKINASEQPYQLIRYKNAFENSKLFFLTLDGKESECEFTKQQKIEYVPISYSNDIINWLEACRKHAIDSPMLREVINQYIFLLKKITGQNSNKQMDMEIINKLRTSKEKFQSFKDLVGIQESLYKSVFEHHFIDLFMQIAEKHNMKMTIDDNFLDGQKWKGINLINEKFSKLNLGIRFGFESSYFRDPLIGLEYLDKELAKENRFDYSSIQSKFDQIYYDTKSNNNYLKYYITWESWKNLNKLEEMIYGDFKNEFEDKLIRLINIID